MFKAILASEAVIGTAVYFPGEELGIQMKNALDAGRNISVNSQAMVMVTAITDWGNERDISVVGVSGRSTRTIRNDFVLITTA